MRRVRPGADAWLRERLRPPEDHAVHLVAELLPPGYASYLRVRNRGRFAPIIPAPGSLGPVARGALVEHLADHSADSALFHYGLGSVLSGAGSGPVTFRAPVAAMDRVRGVARSTFGRDVPGPELIWCADRSWVVSTDFDLNSSYLASNAALAADVAADDRLDVRPVALDDVVEVRVGIADRVLRLLRGSGDERPE